MHGYGIFLRTNWADSKASAYESTEDIGKKKNTRIQLKYIQSANIRVCMLR